MMHDMVARALRALDPEQAHGAALACLKLGFGPRSANDAFPRLRTNLAGLDLPNPIGLAAGFDKNAEVPGPMLAAGFGWVECGTVTPYAQAGNPRPRIFRLSEDRGVINRLGFNNEGLSAFTERLMKRQRASAGIVGANVGANKDSPDRTADYVRALQQVWEFSSYVTVNISSPNTQGLRGLQEHGPLADLLARLQAAQVRLTSEHGARPLFLKVAPDLDETAIRDISELAVAHKLSGLIVSNTTLSRPETLAAPTKSEAGGLSGAPLFELSTRVLRLFAEALGGRIALIGVGGIASAADALAKIKAGASAVQLYSAMVYEGPSLVARMARDLDAGLAAQGFNSIAEAIGADLR
jgi:dihydroorotate dehydrogenase